jgi:hypothetical protein
MLRWRVTLLVSAAIAIGYLDRQSAGLRLTIKEGALDRFSIIE